MAGSASAPSRRVLVEIPEAGRVEALRRWRVLRPHVEDGVPLPRAAGEAGVGLRTARRWLARYRAEGLSGLARSPRADHGVRRLPDELRLLIEGLALRRPAPSAAHVHRRVVDIAQNQGWPVPSYATVYAVIRGIDPAMHTLALDGDKRYREVYDLIYRREASGPNQIWQADHTQLDLWVVTPSGKPGRPWLTVIEDDYSRAIAGYAVNLGAPSALQTALALRQAIWRKSEPGWHVCGIPAAFYTDHGSDFTSEHMEQVAADLKIQLIFSRQGRPRGRGKVERCATINQMCLATLPGYAPRGTPDRAGLARLSLAELDAAIGRFIVGEYNQQRHSETGQPPQARWDASGFLPHLPDSLQQLDLLLLTVATPRKMHPHGIHFLGLRYLDPVLADYVGEPVTIRYDPREVAEIRVFLNDRFLCRAICPELAAQTIGLKDIAAARNARRRNLIHGLTQRASVVDRLVALHQPPCWRRSPRRHRPSPSPRRSSATGRSKQMAIVEQKTEAIAMSPTSLTSHDDPDAEHIPLDADDLQETPVAAPFVVTKEYRRFTEFADAVRRDRYIGLCYGAPGVGKTLSACRYANWDIVEPAVRTFRFFEYQAAASSSPTLLLAHIMRMCPSSSSVTPRPSFGSTIPPARRADDGPAWPAPPERAPKAPLHRGGHPRRGLPVAERPAARAAAGDHLILDHPVSPFM